ncbi:MAG: DUF192 domain-containing protein [Gammaproteobacteria bacterium]|nr:DUF192 domain-containing protein [Gammaproteobacteria bacterium]
MRLADARTIRARTRAGLAGPILALLALLAGTVTPRAVRAAAPEPLSAFPHSVLAIRTAAGQVIDFRIWIANTPQRAEQGLMFVRDLAAHDGMLFPFPQEQPVVMWMKNTYVPLDMLFVDAHGRIAAITRRAQPLSRDLIYAPAGTRAVVELQGGVCDRLGIRVGDHALSNALP